MKHTLKLGLLLAVMVMLTACINIPIGDGNKMKISKYGLTFTDEAGDETSISFDEDDGQLNIKGGKEGEELDVSFGMNVKPHEEFPKDIPFPDDAMFISSVKLEESNATSVMFMTNMEFDNAVSFYNDFVDQAFDEKELLLEEQNIYKDAGIDMDVIIGKRADGHATISIQYGEQDENLDDDDYYEGMVTIIYSKDADEQ